MSICAPRVLIAAPASATGKTTGTCGLMRALVRRGLKVQACKSGPDYIDPMFHAEVVGATSRNLDLFFADAPLVRALLAKGARQADVTVIEGAMGYYDGIAGSAQASAWELAAKTDTPCVLVIDGRGRALSTAAEVTGFVRFRDPSKICGVIVNRVSAGYFPRLKKIIEDETGVPVLGYLPVLADCGLESRHLGLVTASEVEGLRDTLDRIAAVLEDTVDLDALLELAATAPQLDCPDAMTKENRPRSDAAVTSENRPRTAAAMTSENRPRIAVARDEAFCFYYRDSLDLLEELGAQLGEFSPLVDSGLPEGTSGLYLGGGYPELHASGLSANESMRASVKAAIAAGLPTVAECGGFMYLHEWLEDDKGVRHPMVGTIAGTSFKTDRLGRFGYVTLTAHGDSLLACAGAQLPAHEFHYWDSENCGDDFTAAKPLSTRKWECVHATPTLFAGYPHLYLASCPDAAARFVDAAAACCRGGAL